MGNKFKPTGYKGIKQVSEGSVQIQFTEPHQPPTRVTIKCDPYDREILADISADLGQIKREIRRGEFDFLRWFPNKKPTNQHKPTKGTLLRDFLPIWLEARKNGYADQRPLAMSTYKDYVKKTNNSLIPAFGHICLDEVNTTDSYDWAESYGKETTTHTVRNIISPLRVAFDYAVYKQLIPENPIKNVKVYGKQKNQKTNNHDPFEKHEIHAILNNCRGQLHNLIRFAFFTGLRTSELCALQWSDFKPTMKLVHVNKAITQADVVAGDTKTFQSERFVKLSKTALYSLQSQAKYTKKAGQEIFQNPYNCDPWNGDRNIRSHWRTVLRKAGVRYRNPYQTRHTYASMNLSAGENPAWISKQMGHCSVAFTLLTYASYINLDQPDAGELADASFTDIQESNILNFA